jgi:beta-lactamase superfamily II metal-dependent hydrolase
MAEPDDMVQVIVLGKGVGESILIRLHADEWVIIDSFRSSGGRPAALSYLEQRGVDPRTGVTAIVLTHLHADHSDGIYDLVHDCSNATFSMPAAVPEEHWDRLLSQLIAAEPPRSGKLQQIANAFRFALDTGRFRPVGVDTYLNTRAPEVWALAPLPAAQLAAHRATAPAAADAARAILRENYTSIVLWLQAGAATALFGADMDRHSVVGWPAMLELHKNTTRLGNRAGLVKVPHHGSAYAHLDALYETWTVGSIAVLTPNRTNRLPDASTVGRLKRLCGGGVWLAGPQGLQPLRDLAVGTSADTVAVEVTGSRISGDWATYNAGDSRL